MTAGERVIVPVDHLQRRTLRILVIAQVMSGAGLAAGITVGALLAADMLQATAAAGVPAMLFTIGAGGSAVVIGSLSQRRGRRVGLAGGYAVGAVGAAGVVSASALDSVPLLFVSLVVYGAGSAANLQARYAGADLAPPAKRARASAIVLVATTAGAVLGPQLAHASGELARSWGLTDLAGPFVIAGIAYAVGAAVLALWLRPDPLLEALARGRVQPLKPAAASMPTTAVRWRRRVAGAVIAMVVTQAVMVSVMTMTPVHMTAHGHEISAAATVISLHVAAMYLPAPLSGMVVDRWGVPAALVLAAIALAAAGVVLAIAPGQSLVPIATGLVLLGLGWSLGLVAGTQVLSTAPPLAVRARLQGRGDFFIAASGAAGGGASGLIVAGATFAALAWAAAVLAITVALVAPLMHTRGAFESERDRAPAV